MIIARYVLFMVVCSSLMSGNSQAEDKISLRIGGTGSAMGAFQHVAVAFQKTHPGIDIRFIYGLGSGGAIKALQAGKLELALSARTLKSDERRLHAEELARTPLVIAVASNHPVANISLEDVARAFDGTLTTWSDGSPLRLIIRSDSDSETTYLRAISPRMNRAVTTAQTRQGLHVAITDADAADALEKIPGAIGTSTLALMVSEQRKLKPLTLDGKSPSVAALARGEYRYFKPVLAVTTTQPPAAVVAFIAFVKSQQGARLLAANGYPPNVAVSP